MTTNYKLITTKQKYVYRYIIIVIVKHGMYKLFYLIIININDLIHKNKIILIIIEN